MSNLAEYIMYCTVCTTLVTQLSAYTVQQFVCFSEHFQFRNLKGREFQKNFVSILVSLEIS